MGPSIGIERNNLNALHSGTTYHLRFLLMSCVEFNKWQCPLLLFVYFPCQFLNSLMSHVEFKKWPMSLIFFPMSIGLMSHVDFKKRQFRLVEFKGQGP